MCVVFCVCVCVCVFAIAPFSWPCLRATETCIWDLVCLNSTISHTMVIVIARRWQKLAGVFSAVGLLCGPIRIFLVCCQSGTSELNHAHRGLAPSKQWDARLCLSKWLHLIPLNSPWVACSSVILIVVVRGGVLRTLSLQEWLPFLACLR